MVSGEVVMKTVAVVGTGLMGTDIAYSSALAGFEVVLFDSDAGKSANARDRILDRLRRYSEGGKLEKQKAERIGGHVSVRGALEELNDAMMVIECVFEADEFADQGVESAVGVGAMVGEHAVEFEFGTLVAGIGRCDEAGAGEARAPDAGEAGRDRAASGGEVGEALADLIGPGQAVQDCGLRIADCGLGIDPARRPAPCGAVASLQSISLCSVADWGFHLGSWLSAQKFSTVERNEAGSRAG